MYYWGTGSNGYNRICLAKSRVDTPNDWTPLGSVLECQSETEYNYYGPSFPIVLPVDNGPWLMYFCGWGKKRENGKLANTTGLALSDNDGSNFYYWSDHPALPLDCTWDCEGTVSVCVMRHGQSFRMYYTSIGHYFGRPEGVHMGHGEVIPRIGIGYAISEDGIHWTKPLDNLIVSPRGFDTDPYEYIASKPYAIREGTGYRMWLNTFGTAYRVQSLASRDGLQWHWQRSGADADFGVGAPGTFDDHQRCYACVVKNGPEYRCWYTGNGFGATGIGYASARLAET